MELALMMMSAGRDDDALSQVNQILLEQPSRADALRLMAIINFRLDHLDAAWDDFQDLLASGRFTMDALYYLARIADYREEHDRAIRLYTQVQTGPNAVVSQRRAGALIAYELDDPERAVQQLEEFGNNSPNHAIDMILAQAQLLASLERYDEALGHYDQFVNYRPDDEGALLGRAELLLRMDRLDEALGQYRAVVKRWPDSAMSLNAYGYTLADRTEEYKQAEKLIRKALKYDPDSPAIIDSLGWVLYKLGKYDEALVELERAYEKLNDPEVAAHIVEVLHAMERSDDALAVLEAAESEDPDSKLLHDVRKRAFPDSD
jgi:tetratricopeptide (TPR) repeat protein